MLLVIWGSCQAARAFPRMPPGLLAGVPKARKPKGAKSPAGRSKARRAEGAQAGREVFPRPRGKSALFSSRLQLFKASAETVVFSYLMFAQVICIAIYCKLPPIVPPEHVVSVVICAAAAYVEGAIMQPRIFFPLVQLNEIVEQL